MKTKKYDTNEFRIKPCPKCGDVWTYVSNGDYYSGYEVHGFRINCKCGFAWKTIPFCSTRREAVIKWNERVIATTTGNENDKS